jgi:uncharacterized protein YidB (DUF937 family)
LSEPLFALRNNLPGTIGSPTALRRMAITRIATASREGDDMGLLDQVIGGLTGSSGSASPIQSVLMNILTRGQSSSGGYAPVQAPISTTGGLGGLISMFQNAGLGQLAQSWINRGSNQPVSPEQLRNVFGEDSVREMADQSGLPQESFLQQLSHHLPNVVDQLTPNGTLPDEGTISV